MRELIISCDKFDFISILEVTGHKAVNEHASFSVKGHIAKESDEYVLRGAARQHVSFTASSTDGDQKMLFNGLINSIDIHTENEMRILTVNVDSQSVLMDIEPETRTFQDANMTYQNITNHMEAKNSNFNFLWPSDGNRPIQSMTVQYKETDWQYAKRLAGRLGTVVVPDYLLDNPYISIGMTKRPVKPGIEAISYAMKKDVEQFRAFQASGPYSERDAIYYIVKSREIFDLCDPIPFLGLALYVYAIDTRYEGEELVHYYTLKEKEGFFTPRIYNTNIIGATLRGRVKEIIQDKVRIDVDGDVLQTEHKWFPYATPFTQPGGYGWYFMPEIGDEIRLQFPSEQEYDSYVSSAVHVTHGNRQDPQVKYIRTVYGQIIQFDPQKILIDDGAGSSITIHKNQGISMATNNSINIGATADITLSANGKVTIAGQDGVVMQKNGSVINIDNSIDISSGHTRMQ